MKFEYVLNVTILFNPKHRQLNQKNQNQTLMNDLHKKIHSIKKFNLKMMNDNNHNQYVKIGEEDQERQKEHKKVDMEGLKKIWKIN